MEILRGALDVGAELGVTISVSLRKRPQGTTAGKRSATWVRELVELGRSAVVDVVDDATRRVTFPLSPGPGCRSSSSIR